MNNKRKETLLIYINELPYYFVCAYNLKEEDLVYWLGGIGDWAYGILGKKFCLVYKPRGDMWLCGRTLTTSEELKQLNSYILGHIDYYQGVNKYECDTTR